MPFFIAFITLFSVINLSAQENQARHYDRIEDSNTVYVIREIEFDVDGRTRPFALMNNGEFREGERIRGKDEFERYIAQKTQNLNNQLVLTNTTSIEYFLGDREEDGALPVRLLVHAKDSDNFIVLPYPKYSSNDGFSLTLKARDYNFLGTMVPLRVDLGYQYNEKDQHVFSFSFDTEVPFQAVGLDWTASLGNNLAYTRNASKPFYYRLSTGLSLMLPWHTTTFQPGINQYYTFNNEYARDDYDSYATSELYVSWAVPLGIQIANYGELSYTFRPSISINYPGEWEMKPDRKPLLSLSNSLGLGRIDWIGNFRKGLSVSFNITPQLYFNRADSPFKMAMNGAFIMHHPFSEYFGVSARIMYRQWWNYSEIENIHQPHNNAGDVLRGIVNNHLKANQMLSLNLDLPIRVMDFLPSQWFNIGALRIFDCEVFFSPFMDAALVEGPPGMLYSEGTRFTAADIISTAGFDVIAFSYRFRSVRIRGSLGYNLNSLIAKGPSSFILGFIPGWDEIYIGLDLEY